MCCTSESTGKHTTRLGHSVPRARERGWLLAREESFRDPLRDHARIIPRPGGRRDCNQSSRAACRSIRAPWASGWRAGDAALSAQRRVPDGVRPRVTREVRSGCVAVSLAECLVLWFCVSLLCDRHRPSCVHPYRVGVPVVGRTVFRLPINQSINQTSCSSRNGSKPLLARSAKQGGGRAILASQRARRNRRRRATRSRRPDCPGRECVPPRRGYSGTVPTGRGSRDDSREGTAGIRGVGLASEKSGMALPATLSLTRAHHRDCGGRAAVARLPPS